MPPEPPEQQKVEPYAWYLLGVLVLVYVLNFIDRQLLTILAPDLKRDLGISDSDFGFLYGTAFGIFYALFGIPLGKLADRWSRVRLLTIGLALWSLMTALSGLSRNFVQIAAARVGVGIGEATAAPVAYSLISDYFPPARRATALGIYSAGLYVGGGVSLFLGSSIVEAWNEAYAAGDAPLGLAGWQAAFMIVGLPGVLLALLVSTLREVPRGRFETASQPVAEPGTPSPLREFMGELASIVPPFTLIGAARRGAGPLAANLATAGAFAVLAWVLTALVGDPAQWIALAIGLYAICSWFAQLRASDPGSFALLLKSRAFVGIALGYGLLTFIGYAAIAFTPLYAIQELGAPADEAGFMLGSLGALGGVIGVISGGALTDRLARNGDHARRIMLVGICGVVTLACHSVLFTTTSLPLFYTMVLLFWFFSSATLGGSAGAIVNIVPALVRGVATAVFLLGSNILGLALGPYTAGKMSTVLDDLGRGMLSILVVGPVALAMFAMAWLALRRSKNA